MTNKLRVYFFYFIGILLFFIVGFSVFGPKPSVNALSEIKFNTEQSSRLFFKNIRSYYYHKEENSRAQFNLYRLKKDEDSSFQFIIVENWLHDEAYIIVESDSAFYQAGILQVRFTSDDKTDTLYLKEFDREAQYLFAAGFYNHLISNSKVTLVGSQGDIELTEQKVKYLKLVLKDFFKLTGKLR